LLEIPREIVGFVDLSDYFCKIRVSLEFFSMMNPFLHSEMDFEQQKIVICVNKDPKLTLHQFVGVFDGEQVDTWIRDFTSSFKYKKE
jgi:hypothetical protein